MIDVFVDIGFYGKFALGDNEDVFDIVYGHLQVWSANLHDSLPESKNVESQLISVLLRNTN